VECTLSSAAWSVEQARGSPGAGGAGQGAWAIGGRRRPVRAAPTPPSASPQQGPARPRARGLEASPARLPGVSSAVQPLPAIPAIPPTRQRPPWPQAPLARRGDPAAGRQRGEVRLREGPGGRRAVH